MNTELRAELRRLRRELLQATAVSAVDAHEQVVVSQNADGSNTLRFETRNGRAVKTLTLDAAQTAELNAAWQAHVSVSSAAVRPAPLTVDRVTCPPLGTSTPDTIVRNYAMSGYLCFGSGAGNVKIYDMSLLASNNHSVAYVTTDTGELEYLSPDEYIEFSDNPEMTYLNVS